MSTKKSPLEEAKINFEQIQKFAQEQAAIQLEEQVAEKLRHIFEDKINEEVTISINGDNIEITKDGESVNDISDNPELGLGNMELDSDGMSSDMSDEDEFQISDEHDEIGLGDESSIEEIIQNQNIDEMNNMTMEEDAAQVAPETAAPEAVAPGLEAGAAPAPEVEGGAPASSDLMSKLDTLINILLQQQGGQGAPEEQDFSVVDDEAQSVPGATPGAEPAPEAAPAPMQEEEFEINEFEDQNFIDEMEGDMLEIVDEDEMPMEGNGVQEMHGVGHNFRHSNTLGKLPRAGVEHRKDIKENKAQQESKLDELIKENNSLKNTVKGLHSKEKEFEDAFIDLRTQFNEMQLFNGKLALVNKVLMNGGLTTEEKIKICEQFDSVQTYEEASKLFKNIIKENNIKVADGKDRLKGASTNTVKPKSTAEPLYESEEARRAKKLAGITKSEDEE